MPAIEDDGVLYSLSARLTQTSLLAAALLIPVTYLAVSTLRSSRRPAKVRYFIPWVGSALSIGRDSDRFFEDAQNKYGPMFRVLTFGSEAIYVVSPTLINEVYKDQETFVFIPIRLEMSFQIFGLSHSMNYSSYMKGDYFAMHHHSLSPKIIPAVLHSYYTELNKSFKTALSNIPRKSGRTRLRTLLLPPAYESASRAFLGPGFPALDTFGAFQEFDNAFPLLAIGAPNFIVGRAKKAWDIVVDSINEHLSTTDCQQNASELVTSTVEGWAGHGYGQMDAARAIAADLWAINANAIWAAYWIIALHLTQRPEGLKILVAEIDASRRAFTTKLSPGTSIMDDPSAINEWLSSSSATMPLLNSTVQETLRYCSSSSSIRLVTRDTVLGDKEIKKGERVICPSRPIHLDEEVHEFADQYEPARYMDSAVIRTKDGRRVNNHTMPFGGGVSMCEGRHFAQAELRAYVALLLTMMDITVDAKSDLRPKFNMQRIGLGIFHAEGDLDVKVSPRNLA